MEPEPHPWYVECLPRGGRGKDLAQQSAPEHRRNNSEPNEREDGAEGELLAHAYTYTPENPHWESNDWCVAKICRLVSLLIHIHPEANKQNLKGGGYSLSASVKMSRATDTLKYVKNLFSYPCVWHVVRV